LPISLRLSLQLEEVLLEVLEALQEVEARQLEVAY
jgi:hypothetical protein